MTPEIGIPSNPPACNARRPAAETAMLDLNDPSLLTGSALINGSYVPGDRVFTVTNPATGMELAQVADLGVAVLR